MFNVRRKPMLIPVSARSKSPRRQPNMLTVKRALIAAAFFITLFYIVTRSHGPEIPPPAAPIRQEEVLPKTDSAHHESTKQSSSTDTSHTAGKPLSNGGPGGKGGSAGGSDMTGQKTMQDLSKMSTYDKLAYQFPYDVETKFPAYIWQTWKYTPSSGKFKFREEEATWTEHHPGFIHEVITDDVAENLVKLFYASVPEVIEAYTALPLPVLKADYFRYLILLARGGVYSDIDTSALKSAVEWVPDSVPRETIGLVIGIEADPDRPDWHDWYSRRIQFCQWTIQSKPGHPVLRDIVARIAAETLKRKRTGLLTAMDTKNVIEFTGPAVWTDTIFEYFNDPRYFDMSTSKGAIDYKNFTGMEVAKKVGDVIVLPITSFSPGVQQMGAKEPDDPMAFVHHDFEGKFAPSGYTSGLETDLSKQARGSPRARGTSALNNDGKHHVPRLFLCTNFS